MGCYLTHKELYVHFLSTLTLQVLSAPSGYHFKPMENQMEKEMERDMEKGFIGGYATEMEKEMERDMEKGFIGGYATGLCSVHVEVRF